MDDEDRETDNTDAPATETAFLEGQILIAMPGMADPRFRRSIVYLCAHSNDGAMGLIVNRRTGDLTVRDLLEKLEITMEPNLGGAPVHYGGPVETQRGFVLHSSDYSCGEGTLRVDADTSMTATLDILHDIGKGEGPRRAILALGYAGWSPGQLEDELQRNGWLACQGDADLLFGDQDDKKWEMALSKLGVDPALLSREGGTA